MTQGSTTTSGLATGGTNTLTSNEAADLRRPAPGCGGRKRKDEIMGKAVMGAAVVSLQSPPSPEAPTISATTAAGP
jgi:hypothetical protein